MSGIAEIVTFTLIAGSDPVAFLEAAKGTDVFVQSQAGFVRRHLSQNENGMWTDYVLWTDMDAAKTAAAAAMTHPSFEPLVVMIDMDSFSMRHETVRATFQKE